MYVPIRYIMCVVLQNELNRNGNDLRKKLEWAYNRIEELQKDLKAEREGIFLYYSPQ